MEHAYKPNDLLARLAKTSPRYVGEGVNHEGEPFSGDTVIETRLDGRAIRVCFTARSLDGETLFHQEETMISTNPAGELRLWTVSNNMPGVLEHRLHEVRKDENECSLVFRCGDVGDELSFRHQLTMTLGPSTLGYAFAWGMPGGPFEDRSSLVMHPAAE